MAIQRVIRHILSHEEPEHKGSDCSHNENNDLADEPVAMLSIIFSLLVFAFIFEKLYEYMVDYFRKRKKKHFLAIIKKVTTELMILGFLSFFLFLLIQTHTLAKFLDAIGQDPASSEELLEFIHMFLFVIILIYVVIVIYLIFLAGLIKSQWKKFEARSKADEVPEKSPRIIGFFKTPAKFKYYKKLRRLFLTRNHLNEDFDYYEFLKSGFKHVFAEVIELNWKIWLLLIVLLGIDVVDHRYLGSDLYFNFLDIIIWAYSLYLWSRVITVRNRLCKDSSYLLPRAPEHKENAATPLLKKALKGETIHINGNETQPLFKTEIFWWRFMWIPICRVPTKYASLFPFGKPRLLIKTMQMLVFFQSVYISVLFTLMWNKLKCEWYFLILNIISPALNITFLMGTTLPVMCQIVSVDYVHQSHSFKLLTDEK